MDFLKAVNIIGRDLEEAMVLLEQISGLSGPEKAEVELARSRVRSASDLLKLLPGMTVNNEPAPGPVTEQIHRPVTRPVTEQPQVPANEPVADQQPEKANWPVADQQPEKANWPVADQQPETVNGPVAERQPEAVNEPVAEQPPVPITGQKTEPVPQPAAPTGPARQPTANRPAQESAKPILADRFIPSGTLGEKISTGRQEEVISTVIHSKPIDDIGAAIGMNDRFLYIRELFSGDALAYSDTIRRLNAAASLGEAMRILDESTVMGSDPAAQSSFVDVVRRKFSLHV